MPKYRTVVVEDGGRLNNYAIEPEMYVAEPPNPTQKRNYLILGILALTLIGGLVAVTALVSGMVAS